MSPAALQHEAKALMFVVIALAVVMLISQERSRTNNLLTAGNILVGLAIGSSPHFVNTVSTTHPGQLARLQGMFEVGAIVVYALLVLAAAATGAMSRRRFRAIQVCTAAAIAMGVWHAIASYAWPAQRLNDYELSLGDPGVFTRPGFWLFAGFWLILIVPFAIAWGLLAIGGGLDPAEARRAQTGAVASVLAVTLTAIPPALIAPAVAIWVCASVYGQLHYTSARAERGVFLSRFLSPRVTELVATRGLAEAMKPHLAEITVVCADLRGFTAYSEGVPSQAVVDLLAEYYDAVGVVAARHGATITNYAGDGVLILVGAPIADPSHAATGVELARELLAAVAPVLDRWQTRVHTLGIGVGVASGSVTVGAIAAETRMEYTAIGPPVNLAARLCAVAAADEVLIDEEAARLSADENIESRGGLDIKGFAEKQQVYVSVRSSS